MNQKLDLFKTLDAINSNNLNYINKLSLDEKKQIVPLLYMRWLSGNNDKITIESLNENSNNLIFSLYSHPELLIKLLMASCSNARGRFKYIKFNNKKYKNPNTLDLIRRINNCSTREAKMYLDQYNLTDLLDIAAAYGESNEFIKELTEEFS